MTVDYAVGAITADVAADGSIPIRPGDGENYCIHTIAHGGAAELYLTDGTNDLLLDSDTVGGAWINQTLFITYTNYLKVVNKSVSAADIGFTGIQTK